MRIVRESAWKRVRATRESGHGLAWLDQLARLDQGVKRRAKLGTSSSRGIRARAYAVCRGLLVAFVLGSAAVASAPGSAAAEDIKARLVEPFLPDNTTCLLVANVRQVLDHALVREYYHPRLRHWLDSLGVEAEMVLDVLDVDPLRDIDVVVLAAPRLQSDPKDFLLVIHGRFSEDRMRAVWQAGVQAGAGKLQQVPCGRGKTCPLYETASPKAETAFWSLLDQNTALLSPRKEYVLEAIAKRAGQRKAALNSELFRELLARADGAQSLWMVFLGASVFDSDGVPLEKLGVEAVSGGMNLQDELSVDVAVHFGPDASPEDEACRARGDLAKAQAKLVEASRQWWELAPLVKLVDAVQVTSEGQVVTLRGAVPGEVLERAIQERLPGSMLSSRDIYRNVVRSTVLIIVPELASGGSGSLIHGPARLVLTNYHVVGRARQAMVLFPMYHNGRLVAEREPYEEAMREGRAIRARVLARDPSRDLALLRLDRLAPDAQALPLAPRSVEVTDTVHVVGNADVGALWVYSQGIVRQVARQQFRAHARHEEHPPIDVDATVVLADCPINAGDSGGPLVNDRGELVGVTQGQRELARRVSVFIDVSEVRAMLEDPRFYQPAVVLIRVPRDAKVWIDGAPTQQRGELRRFQTPPLSLARTFSYKIEAIWNENGQQVMRERHIDYLAGETVEIDLR